MTYSFIDKIGLIMIENRKILMVRSHNKPAWLLPGGKREKGETDQETLIREIQEELGVNIIESSISYHGTFEAQAYGKPEGTNVRITCYTAVFSEAIHISSEIDEFSWINSRDIEETSVTGKLILRDLKQKNLID